MDAMCSKGQSFIPHIKQVLIFHSLQKNIKQRSRFVSTTPNAAQNVTGDNVDEGTEGNSRVIFFIKIQQFKKMDPLTERENNSISMEYSGIQITAEESRPRAGVEMKSFLISATLLSIFQESLCGLLENA